VKADALAPSRKTTSDHVAMIAAAPGSAEDAARTKPRLERQYDICHSLKNIPLRLAGDPSDVNGQFLDKI
jgi:hypothetical protein